MFTALVYCFAYLVAVTAIALCLCHYLLRMKRKSAHDLIARIPGPKPKYPFIGNLDIFRIRGVPLNQSIFRIVSALAKIYEHGGIFKFSFGTQDVVVLFRHNTMSSILTSNINIDKSDEYQYLWPWLGKGLLTSTGPLWKSRRKMLTPAFHFKVLEDFIPVMNEQSNVLVNNLRNDCNKPFIDIREPIVQCTLDIICETAMGVSIGAQIGNNKEYVNAIHRVGEVFMQRIYSPWLWPDFLFNISSIGREFNCDLNILHSLTRNVITKRKDEIISTKKSEVIEESNEKNIYMSNKSRKRLAFLDLLLDYHIEDNNLLSLENIREEVDTFMFEGHDTTSVSLSWTLYLLGLHPEYQIRVQEELESIFGNDKDRDITPLDLKSMVFLESVIKESLRLFPSVPYIARTLSEETTVEGYVLPEGTKVFLLMERLHYDPKVFADPLHFRPERFLDNTTSNINPYTYVPFSAGPRSCIGQRFALAEEKIILAKIFLNFHIRSLDPRDQINSSVEMVFRSKDPIRVQVMSR